MRTQEADLIDRAGGERMIQRLADAFFVEMLPDHRLVDLYRGHSNEAIVAQQRRLLSHLLSGSDANDGPSASLGELFAPIAPERLTHRRIRLMAEIMIDCMVDEAVPAKVILGFLDRLSELAPGVLTDTAAARELGWGPISALEARPEDTCMA